MPRVRNPAVLAAALTCLLAVTETVLLPQPAVGPVHRFPSSALRDGAPRAPASVAQLRYADAAVAPIGAAGDIHPAVGKKGRDSSADPASSESDPAKEGKGKSTDDAPDATKGGKGKGTDAGPDTASDGSSASPGKPGREPGRKPTADSAGKGGGGREGGGKSDAATDKPADDNKSGGSNTPDKDDNPDGGKGTSNTGDKGGSEDAEKGGTGSTGKGGSEDAGKGGSDDPAKKGDTDPTKSSGDETEGAGKATPNPTKDEKGSQPPANPKPEEGTDTKHPGPGHAPGEGSPTKKPTNSNSEPPFGSHSITGNYLIGLTAIGVVVLLGGFIVASKSSLCGFRRRSDDQPYEPVRDHDTSGGMGGYSNSSNPVDAEGWNDGWEDDWDGDETAKA